MSSTRAARPQAVSTEVPAVPLTIEGFSVLHQMMRVRWPEWRGLPASKKNEIVNGASAALAKMEQDSGGQSGLYSLLGHKGDLMWVHFRSSFEGLNQIEMQLANLRLSDYIETTTSYLSVIELGLYESSLKTYRELTEKGIDTILSGFALPESNVHSPNERFLVPYFAAGIDTVAALFTALGRLN